MPHLALLLLGVAASEKTAPELRPRVRWGQTNTTVYVTVDPPHLAKCSAADSAKTSVAITRDGFSLFARCEADSAEWRIELREDVSPEISRSEATSKGGTLLTLKKRLEHRWDRLLWDEASASPSKDWKREDSKLLEEDEYELPRAQNIQQLSTLQLESLAADKVVVVAMRYPWCTGCEEKDKAFVKASKIVGGKLGFKNVAFAALDFRENKDAARRWSPTPTGNGCGDGDKCPLRLFKPDEPLDEPYLVDLQILYEMDEASMMMDPMAGAPGHTPKSQNTKPNFDKFEQDLKLLLPPALTYLQSDQDVAEFRRRWETAVVASNVNATEFRRVARTLRGEATFGLAPSPAMLPANTDSVGEDVPTVVLWGSAPTLPVFSNDSSQEDTDLLAGIRFDGEVTPIDALDLRRWVMINGQPLIQNYSWDLKSRFESLGLLTAVLWVNHSDSNNTAATKGALEAFQALCEFRRGRSYDRHLMCCLQDEGYSYYQREYGSHDPYPYPFFGLTDKLGYGEGLRYGYPFKEPQNKSAQAFFRTPKKAVKSLNTWINKVLAGKVPPSHESGLLPAEPKWIRGTVQDIVWKTYQNDINGSTADVLLELYDNQRKQAHVSTATMRVLAATLKDYSNLKVARMESSENYVQPMYGRKQYSKDTEYYWVPPSIASGEWAPENPIRYTGSLPATPEKLLRFLKKHSLSSWSLKEALETAEDLGTEIMGHARVEQRMDDRADDEKQDMIKKMMATLKKEKGLVDVGEMMGLRKAAETMGVPDDSKKDKKTKDAKTKKDGKSPLKKPAKGSAPKIVIDEKKKAELAQKQLEERRQKIKKDEAKYKEMERKEKEKRKQRQQAEKLKQEKRRKEMAEAQARAAKEREEKRKREQMLKPTTPVFVWGQAKESMRVSIAVPNLNASTLNLTINDDAISLRAKDVRGRSYILDFELREFVVASNSTWEFRYSAENPLNPKPDGVTMNLQKSIPHRWDRFVQNLVPLKPFMKRDWVEDDGELEEEEDVDLPSGSNIKKVTAQALQALTEKHTMVLAALRYPWCKKCNEKDRYFAKTARDVKDKEYISSVKFAVVDIREEKQMARKHNISCDDQCELLIFKQDEPDEPYKVPGKRYTEEIQIECYKHLLPVVSVCPDKETLDRVTSAFDTAIVSFFKGEEKSDPWYKKFRAVARELRGHAIFGAVFESKVPRDFGIDFDPEVISHDDEASSGRPLVLLFKPKEQRHVEFLGELTLERLTHFSRILSLPLVSTYTFESRQKYQELKVPLGQLWINGESEPGEPATTANEAAMRVLRRLAHRFSGHLVFVDLNNTRDAMLMRPMGLDPRRVPTFGIAALDEMNADRYGFNMGAQNLREVHEFWKDEENAYNKIEVFCDSFLSGTLEESHESAELPPTYVWPGPGVVHEAVWKSFRQSVFQAEHAGVLLELYSPFRPQHRTYATVTDLVAEAMQPLVNIKVVRMDTQNNYVLKEFGLSDKDKEKGSTFFFVHLLPNRQRRIVRFGGKSGKAEALPEKLLRFVHREGHDYDLAWDQQERVTWVNKEAAKRIRRLRALEKDFEKKMQDEWMQKEMEEFERYKRLGKFDNLPPMD